MNITKRLIAFYKASYPPASESCMTEIWEGITRVYQNELKEALLAEDENRVEAFLRNYVANGGSHGMDHSPDIYSSPDDIDRSKLSDDDLMIPHPPGTKNNMTATGTVANMIYDFIGRVPEHIMEIGAGLGFLGVVMQRWGAKSYTDIDIPTNALAAAFFLSRCCGENCVYLYGEPKVGQCFGNYYPSTDCRNVLNQKHDVICNINSFPEIPCPAQDVYLSIISECLTPGGIFLSVNHEGDTLNQRSMSGAMQLQNKLACILRRPSILYAGYWDEVYKKTN